MPVNLRQSVAAVVPTRNTRPEGGFPTHDTEDRLNLILFESRYVCELDDLGRFDGGVRVGASESVHGGYQGDAG
ncbi:MAG: hypothetical protein AAF412_03620 [Pseudomonadota bacterium]